MWLVVAIEGLLLLFSGWWLPEVPMMTHVIGLLWCANAIATWFAYRKPALALISGLLLFIGNAVNLQSQTRDGFSLSYFLYMHSTELLYVIAAALLWFSISRKSAFERGEG